MLNANPTIAAPWLRVRNDVQRLPPVDAGHNGRAEGAVDSGFGLLSHWPDEGFCSHNRAPMSSRQKLVRVAVPVPLADAFDYLVAAGDALPPVGSRVRVPFGRGERIGLVVEQPAKTDVAPARLKTIGAVLDAK